MEEIWKDIKGYEGLYQVSNLGRVKSLERKTRFDNQTKIIQTSFLSNRIGKRGYVVVSLFKNNKGKTIPIHRLIADAFIPNPENKPCIDHINTIRTDNRIENLHWVTSKENSNNPLTLAKNKSNCERMWLNGAFDNRNNIHYRKVGQYTKSGELVKIWDSIIEASTMLNIDSSSISAVCRGTNPKRHTAGGFIWQHIGKHYKKEYEQIR